VSNHSHTVNGDVAAQGFVTEGKQQLFFLATRMNQQLILLISFLGGTGIVLGLAVGLAFLKKSPQRWLMIIGLIALFWAVFYLAYWWTS
jgi:cellobiose-specific phosphotransferase system component IIC